MTGRSVLTLVLLVSLAHALVHAYEMALPSVEQEIAAEYYEGDEATGKRFTGLLSNAWRLMWGIGAIAAGWLVDRLGSHRLLIVYLLGCSLSCAMASFANTEHSLFASMMIMGGLASIYHPAGLALISHETNAESRPFSLGLHGVFGSAGIGFTPFFIGALMDVRFDWRQVYLVMFLPGLVLAAVFVADAMRRAQQVVPKRDERKNSAAADYTSFFVLTLMAAVQGFVYSALMSFLVRYLDQGQQSDTNAGNYLALPVLLLGCVGQFVAGVWAKPARLERQLTAVTFGNVPLLLWMAIAVGWWRPISAGLLAMVHFMHQPLYNSLIAKYTPSHRRSLCYGFSFAMGLGLGSFGALAAGYIFSDFLLYSTLALVEIVGGLICLVLCWLNRD